MRDYIEAREGYVLTDGEIFGKRIYLAEGVDASSFREIEESEYERIYEEEIDTAEGDPSDDFAE